MTDRVSIESQAKGLFGICAELSKELFTRQNWNCKEFISQPCEVQE
ncbi:hypothetical protein [Microbulbifer spongiae]|uniref:Uncharacterized protein n=1 Tax=Microbulbifer spongiae TaxID=2944933 RepID=A0ABY9EAM2_9GAMM|nr:hypothetical protein [Microbulbifer sp. MI-G]WKD50048.1 hypothetical protein M8T91_01070 [Microbulbifer sp. MI-G]